MKTIFVLLLISGAAGGGKRAFPRPHRGCVWFWRHGSRHCSRRAANWATDNGDGDKRLRLATVWHTHTHVFVCLCVSCHVLAFTATPSMLIGEAHVKQRIDPVRLLDSTRRHANV
jgi:hypothetical protein